MCVFYYSQCQRCIPKKLQTLWRVGTYPFRLFRAMRKVCEFQQLVHRIIYGSDDPHHGPLLAALCCAYHQYYPDLFQSRDVEDSRITYYRSDAMCVGHSGFLQRLIHMICDVFPAFSFPSRRDHSHPIQRPPSTPSILSHCKKFVISLYQHVSKTFQSLLMCMRMTFQSPIETARSLRGSATSRRVSQIIMATLPSRV